MNILDTIGHTPLIYLNRVSAELPAKIFVKYEARNPGGSIKDRAALGYVRAAIREGALAPGGTVVEATSGNLGIGLAVVKQVVQLHGGTATVDSGNGSTSFTVELPKREETA